MPRRCRRDQKGYLAYLLPEEQPDWINTVDSWIELKKRDGAIQFLCDYWILGREAEKGRPRWAVVRNVLHRVDRFSRPASRSSGPPSPRLWQS